MKQKQKYFILLEINQNDIGKENNEPEDLQQVHDIIMDNANELMKPRIVYSNSWTTEKYNYIYFECESKEKLNYFGQICQKELKVFHYNVSYLTEVIELELATNTAIQNLNKDLIELKEIFGSEENRALFHSSRHLNNYKDNFLFLTYLNNTKIPIAYLLFKIMEDLKNKNYDALSLYAAGTTYLLILCATILNELKNEKQRIEINNKKDQTLLLQKLGQQ